MHGTHTEYWGGTPEAALLNKPTLPPTGGGNLQHPMRVALAIIIGTAEAAKTFVQSIWRNTRSFDSSSRMTFPWGNRDNWPQRQSGDQPARVHSQHLQVLNRSAIAVNYACAHAVTRVRDNRHSISEVGQDTVIGLHAAASGSKLN
jgi:hypothetical protein